MFLVKPKDSSLGKIGLHLIGREDEGGITTRNPIKQTRYQPFKIVGGKWWEKTHTKDILGFATLRCMEKVNQKISSQMVVKNGDVPW